MVSANVRSIVDELKAADTLAAVDLTFRHAIATHGFDAHALGYGPAAAQPAERGEDEQRPSADDEQRAPFLLLNWPKAWLELYAREGFAAEDVVVAEAVRATDPFTWTEVRRLYPGASERVFAAAATFGWQDGFCIPVHSPHAPPRERFGVISLAAASLAAFDAPARTFVATVSLTAFAQARRLASATPGGARGPALSRRERQVLALVADGLGDQQIAEVLRVTRATAHFHVERAKRALGATTRAQAVAIALTRSML